MGASTRVAVIGGGVSGLSAALALRRERPDLDVTLFERDARAGGLVRSEYTPGGWLIEHGPDAMASGDAEVGALLGALSLDDQIVAPSAESGGSRVLQDGTFHPLPAGVLMPGPGAVAPVLASSLLSWRGRARLLVEGFVPPRRGGGDESVESFVVRRMGRDVFENLVRPLVQGIRGVDPAELSARLTLGRLVEMEERHGSIALGIVRTRTKSPQGKRPRGPAMASFRRGMGALPRAMARELGPSVHLGLAVDGLSKRARGAWELRLSDGGSFDADAVIVAAPAHAAARLLEALDADVAAALDDVRYAPAVHVTLGYRTPDLGDAVTGTGFLVGRAPARRLRACTWASRKFPGRAPDGTTLARCSLSLDDIAGATDDELVRAARDELRALVGVSAAPVFERVVRAPRALPRYEPGHRERVARVTERCREWPSLAFAGSAWQGAGVADCVASGARAARQVAHALVA